MTFKASNLEFEEYLFEDLMKTFARTFEYIFKKFRDVKIEYFKEYFY